MSAPQSSRRLRNRVHSQLTALHQGGQFAVPRSVERYLSDQLIDEIAHEYRDKCPDAPAHGRAAIITAGVPGAGKSFAIDMLATDHRRIDPDGIKDLILIRLDRAGLLDIRHNHVLADGKPVHPSELALWVHDASTEAANRVRAVSQRRGENFVMEGTLSWTPLIDSYVNDLASDDYERLTIVDIEVPFTLAVEQSKHRWWAAREAGRIVDDVALGGRFIAQAALEGLYTRQRRVSKCAVNARKLRSDANHAGIETDLLIVSRTSTGSEYRAWLRPDGDIDPSQGAPLGAVCIKSGAILTNPTAIGTGVGRSRVYRS
ncbi:zeta toxin family protein [Mycobacterium sp. 852014-52144_SCH5372336]|uniref:zeta toxin family protein n=1 Tax=Mycobacterium sp. 852014-52144_SCH5372336 TaxID=1834115 RepID=UPI0018D382BB|nr:zeta toxin family protein [Mycobacterium sp. 852014-52144_SCH5372336]